MNFNLKDFDKIYVFVSGGIDSTYLYEKLKRFYKDKVYPLNCYNPFETNKTLLQIKENDKNFIQLKVRNLKYPYKHYIFEAFKRLPFAIERLVKTGLYDKKTNFSCCYYLKHKVLFQAKKFAKGNVVFINGIKAGDGKQRRVFLSQLRNGSFKSIKESTFFLKHKKTNMLYAYPFRDYTFKNFPKIVITNLKKKYPFLTHSGCYFCPVLVMFEIKESKNYKSSLLLAEKLNIKIKSIKNFCPDSEKISSKINKIKNNIKL